MAEHDINLNQADVIVEESHIGSTVHHNISKGTQVRVPWGSLDWLGFFAATLFVLVFIALLGGFAAYVLSTVRW